MTTESNAPNPVSSLPDVVPASPPARDVEPPPLPAVKKAGFFRRLFTSRRKQQVAIQNGYAEIVDLVRSIRAHLDRQEMVQTRVLQMIEKVPDTMERQHEIMTLFQQQLETGVEHDRRLTDSMDHLTSTLTAMDESHRGASRTIADLIGRSRETEQLLREVMRRAERRMAILLALVVVGVAVAAFALYHKMGAITSVSTANFTPIAEIIAPEILPILPPVVLVEEPVVIPILEEMNQPEIVPEIEPEVMPPAAKPLKKKSKRPPPAVAPDVENAAVGVLAEDPAVSVGSWHIP